MGKPRVRINREGFVATNDELRDIVNGSCQLGGGGTCLCGSRHLSNLQKRGLVMSGSAWGGAVLTAAGLAVRDRVSRATTHYRIVG
jgi:hypothetical protein